jgi:glycosyltransferase involved in cell wall biosynthesis
MPGVDEPAVSVVIPAYQAEAFLGEVIESALAQTHAPREVIVVDDGSSDGTAGVAARYEEVRLLRLPHRGQAAARNSGFAAASGELIAFNDADDIMLPERIAVQVEHLQSNPQVALIIGGQELMIEEEAGAPFWHPDADSLMRRAGRPERGNVHTMTPLFRREVFERVGGFDETMVAGEDVDWLLRVKEAGMEVSIIKQPLVIRRVHDGGLTQKPDWERRGLVEIFQARIKRKREAP